MPFGWERYVGTKGKVLEASIALGLPLRLKSLRRKLGFTAANVVKRAHEVLGRWCSRAHRQVVRQRKFPPLGGRCGPGYVIQTFPASVACGAAGHWEGFSFMSSNPLRVLNGLGQSVWFDYIRRHGPKVWPYQT